MEPFHWWAVIFGFSSAEYKWKDELWWDAFETNFTFSVRWDQQMTTEPRKKVCLFVSVPGDSGVNKPVNRGGSIYHLGRWAYAVTSSLTVGDGLVASEVSTSVRNTKDFTKDCVCVLVALCSSQAEELYGYKKGIWGECLFGTQPLNECCLRTNWSQHSAAPLLSREPQFPPSDCPIINLCGRLLRLSVGVVLRPTMLWF